MGYTIAVHARTPQLQERMLRFMGNHYRSWREITGAGQPGDFDGSALGPTSELSYDKSEVPIGFDYGGLSGWEREYVYAVCRWMAIRVGKRKATFRTQSGSVGTAVDLAEEIPYLVYDEDQEIPIGPNVDELGIKVSPSDGRPLYPDAFFDLTEAEQEAYDAEAATRAGEGPVEAKQRRKDLREKYTRPYVLMGVTLMRSELERLERAWQSL
jgi:hypothetical protein